MKVFRIDLRPVFMLYVTYNDFGIMLLHCFGFEMLTGVRGKLFIITFLFKEYVIKGKKEKNYYGYKRKNKKIFRSL